MTTPSQGGSPSGLGVVPWQRCQFHLQQNAMAYVTKQELKPVVGAIIRAIFNASNRAEAEALLAKAVYEYSKSLPKLATWMESALPKGFTVFSLPAAHRQLLRITNRIERVN